MRRKAIMLATPSLGTVSIWWTQQVATLLWPLNLGRRVAFQQDAVGDEIAEARNALVTRALKLDAEGPIEIDSIFWIDDDVLVQRTALCKLYDHHVPIAAGLYFTKGEPASPLAFPGRLQGTIKFEPDKVTRVWGVGMGLTLVKLYVYKSLLPGIAKDKYGRPEFYKTNRTYEIEDGMIDCGGTEDLYFCQLVTKLGIEPLLDTSKHTVGFHHDRDTNQGYPKEQFDQWQANKPIQWQTETGIVSWE